MALSGSPSAPPHQAPTPRLAAWEPTTLQHWPGRVVTTLFLSGCSFTCPFCHHASLRQATQIPIDWIDVIRHLECRRDWIDGVVVTGGEPTEDPDLPSLLAALKEMDVAVRLETNGSHPEVLFLLLAEGLVDSVALDVKTIPRRYDEICGVPGASARLMRCVELLTGSHVEHEFRTTVYPGLVALEDLPGIARSLRGGRLFALQQFVPVSTLDPEASSVRPYAPDELRAAAASCARFLPTIVRGLAAGEDL